MKQFFIDSIDLGECRRKSLRPPPSQRLLASHATISSPASGVKLPPECLRSGASLKPLFRCGIRTSRSAPAQRPNRTSSIRCNYTGWLAADGRKFDSSYDHPRPPVLDKDGKPVLGDDGKPKLGDPQPITFPQGFGRVIPGFDQGFHRHEDRGQAPPVHSLAAGLRRAWASRSGRDASGDSCEGRLDIRHRIGRR